MEHLSLEKRKRIALFGTVFAGVILIVVFILIQISKQDSADSKKGERPAFKELYTTLKDTTQQYFTKEK